MYASLSEENQVEENDYHMHRNLLFHLGNLCIPQGDRLSVMRESHLSLIAGHFGVRKIVAHLRRYCYWPHMIDSVSYFIRGCYICATRKPSNRKLGLYTSLPIPSRPWESVSMDFVGCLPMSRKQLDYLYVVLDRFSKMCILMLCKKTNTAEQIAEL